MKFKCLCGKDRYIRKRLNQKGWSERIERCPSCGLGITSNFVNGRFGNSRVHFVQSFEFTEQIKIYRRIIYRCNKCYDITVYYAFDSNEFNQVTSMYLYCTNCDDKGERILGIDVEDLSRYLFIFTKRGKYIYFED